MSSIFEKRVPFFKNVRDLEKMVSFDSFSLKKGYFLVFQVSVFEKKGVFFSFVNISERGNFLIWRTIIRLPFHMRVAGQG